MTAATMIPIQVRFDEHVTDYSLALRSVDVSVLEVFNQLGLEGDALIDGRQVAEPDAVRAVDVLRSGCLLAQPESLSGGETSQPGPASTGDDRIKRVEVSVVAGLDAGGSVDLSDGLHHIDAGGASFYMRVEGAQGENGCLPWHERGSPVEAWWGDDNVVAMGEPVAAEPGFGPVVHRPLRQIIDPGIEPIERLGEPASVADPAPLSWATLLAPIPVAVMMALLFRPVFAVFAAMGPVMAIGRWVEARRRFRRECSQRSELLQAQRAADGRALARQAEVVARARWQAQPHVAELWRRARTGSVRLWERRAGHDDFLHLSVGVGPDEVPATMDSRRVGAAAMDRLILRPVPHVADLQRNRGLGVHGAREDVLAVARSIVLQCVTLHGPADVIVGLLCAAPAVADWDWVKWIPHLDRQLVANQGGSLVKHLGATAPNPTTDAMSWSQTEGLGRTTLIIVDDAAADVAALYRAATDAHQHVRFLVVAPQLTALPAVCSAVVDVANSTARFATPERAGARSLVCPIGISLETTNKWARSLAGLIDPEADLLIANPQEVPTLCDVLSFDPDSDLAQRWSSRRAGAPAQAPLGTSVDGPFLVDLAEDGPHCLIAGTTGSGKSELLRTLVVGLAAESPPDSLNFVLIDFKGGGAFDVVDRLPHVAGLITDLDEALIERAITSLRAELQRRELLFRDLGVSDFAHAVSRSSEPLARLVVVIDEFAALATEYSDLMSAIIDLAARGRSLGMHLVLATQRPSGVVDQKIRANTNLRIALRVQDAFDSHDVVGVGDAASIDRKAPGRAIVRVGGDGPVTIQTAYGGSVDSRADRCTIEPLRLIQRTPESVEADVAINGCASELEILVDSIVAAGAARTRARALWVDPLPSSLDWIDLRAWELDQSHPSCTGAGAAVITLGLEDVPERQAQQPWGWDPSAGPLAVFAASATCAAKTLLSVGIGFSLENPAVPSHVYVIDGGSRGLADLQGQSSTGAYITIDETDRVQRVVAMFERELAARRLEPQPDQVRLVLIIDNLAAVMAVFSDVQAAELVDRLSGLARDGAAMGVHLVVSVRTVRDLSHRLSQQFGHRLVFALADMASYLTLGLRASEVPLLPAMRAIDLSSRRQVHMVEPPSRGSWARTVELEQRPEQIVALPSLLNISSLPGATTEQGALVVPAGIDANDLGPIGLVLQAGQHALVVGRNGMGRSNVLRVLKEQMLRSTLEVRVACIAPPGSPLGEGERTVAPRAQQLATAEQLQAFVTGTEGEQVIIIDDAERVTPELAAALHTVVEDRGGPTRLIVGTTPTHARSVRSWISKVRLSGVGVLLGGSVGDGDIFDVRLPPLAGLGQLPGRGFVLTRGRCQPAQLAWCDPSS